MEIMRKDSRSKSFPIQKRVMAICIPYVGHTERTTNEIKITWWELEAIRI